jgi:hypothetical protein
MGISVPKEVTLEDKSIVFGMIQAMHTKKKFKNVFHDNIATLQCKMPKRWA